MIEFQGKRSKKDIKAQRIEMCKSLRPLIIGTLVFYIGLFIGFGVEKSFWGLMATLLLFVLSALLCVIGFAAMLSKGSLEKTYMNIRDDITTILVYDDRFIYKNKYEKHEYNVSKITRVEDWGDYYTFSFKRWKHSGLVCPKNWITEGTIEEFEKFFKDKLIDRTKKSKDK